MKKRTAITGCGVVSAAGVGPENLWKAIARGESGLGPLTLFDSPRCGGAPVGEIKTDPAAQSGLSGGSRTDHLAVWAARQAFDAARLSDVVKKRPRRIGVVLGTTTGGMIDAEMFVGKLVKAGEFDLDCLKYHLCATPANTIAETFGLAGVRETVSDACASGASAIGAACELLLAGEADVILAGGADCLTRLTVNGFTSLLNVDPGGCRPFDAGRKGMSLGEGAAVLVLETEEHARSRGARIEGFVSGWANRSDAFHPTKPSPDGRGIFSAMKAALDEAGISPGDIDYINAHGTGTPENDAAEACALVKLFGPDVPPVSSTKGYTGHTLAAAGAIEALICMEAIKRGALPANAGLINTDPDMGFEPVIRMRQARIRTALSNSLSFGGTNFSLVLEGARE